MNQMMYMVKNKQTGLWMRRGRMRHISGFWTHKFCSASITPNIRQYNKAVAQFGEEICELVPIFLEHVPVKHTSFYSLYDIKGKRYLANKNLRKRKKIYTNNILDAGIFKTYKRAFSLIDMYRRWSYRPKDWDEAEWKVISGFLSVEDGDI